MGYLWAKLSNKCYSFVQEKDNQFVQIEHNKTTNHLSTNLF
jgi:hypothetical protein